MGGATGLDVIDSEVDSLRQLYNAFGGHLYAAAESLVDLQCIRDVRVLQAGDVIVGIADCDVSRGTSHRVYIRNRSRGPDRRTESQGIEDSGIEGECGCGERHPCVHVAAVLIAAARGLQKAAPATRRAQREPSQPGLASAPAPGASAQRQRLCYLLGPGTAQRPGSGPAGQLQLTLWVAQTAVNGERAPSESPHPFALRALIGGERAGGDWSNLLPRYVDAQDKEILRSLAARQVDGPWELAGAVGATLLRQAVATGRTFWQSVHGKPLREGANRRAAFAWETMPNGDQKLRSAVPGSIDLNIEPAIYIDATVSECGKLELPCSQALLRQYWMQPAITPEQAASANEHIAHDASAATFPRLRTAAVQRQPLNSLKARLVLSAAPEAVLYFIYNGLPVDSRRLRPEHDSVRQTDGDVIREIPRDRVTERHFHAQLQSAFVDTVPKGQSSDWLGRGSWLAFMMRAVPALQAEGWEIVTEDRFPYRIAAPDNWYADVNRHGARQQEWFDLRLGVLVDGHAVNVLPALASFVQAELGTAGADLPVQEASYCRVGDQLLVQLEDGRYVPLAIERIQRIAHTLVELFDRDGLNAQQALSLPASQASRLAQLARGLDEPTPGPGGERVLRSDDPSVLELIEGLDDSARLAPLPAPAHFRATLRHYQQEGLGWLQFLRHHRLGGILADDMGLGKTVQTLAHLVLEKESGRLRKPSLIVAPVSVLGNWSQEIPPSRAGAAAPDPAWEPA